MTCRRLLHYEILEKLGEGGMGVVYRARDTHLDRSVAIKVLPADKVADADRKARFVQEAKSASSLNHPGIVHVYDIAEQDGVDFIVMEHVAGKTLDELIPRKGLRLNATLKYAIEIADALAAAHAAGIVHRDLKPANVMVGDDGRVRVLDFGLAKLTEARRGDPDESTRAERPTTGEGTILGTTAYMSPEQATGKKVDARSDIFSFGALLYEMATGRRAFSGNSQLDVLAAIVKDEPAPLADDIPHDLRKLVSRCLRKDPERRYQLMKDVRVELADLKEESDSGKLRTAATPERKRPLPWIAAGTAALVLVAALAWWMRGAAPADDLKALPLTSFAGLEGMPSLSPDGKRVAFIWNGAQENNFDIYVQQIGAAGTPMRLTTSPLPESSPAWSPDDRWIAFLRAQPDGQAAIVLIPPLGGPERTVGQTIAFAPVNGLPIQPPLCWTPDAKWLAFVGRDDAQAPLTIWAVSIDTGERHQLTSVPVDRLGPGSDNNPSVSPDGRLLAFSRTRNYVAGLFTERLTPDMRPEGAPVRVNEERYPDTRGIAWTPDGRELLYGAGAVGAWILWRVPVSGGGPAKRLVYALPSGAYPTLAAHRLVYTSVAFNSNIWRLDLRTGERRPVISTSSYLNNYPRYSPDGRRIQFLSNRSGTEEVWTCDAEGSNCVQLTAFNGPAGGAGNWSPDGRFMAVDSRTDGQAEIYLLPAEGGALRRMTNHPATDCCAAWAPDGQWLYFDSSRSGRREIWKMSRDGGEPVQVTRAGGTVPSVSPDGRHVYYARSAELFRMPAGGGAEERVLPRVIHGYGYRVTAKGVYFMPDGRTIQFLDPSNGQVKTLATLDKEGRMLDVSPGDLYVVWSQADGNNADLMLVENVR